ncbi:hypothetical protein CR513_56250, partial [Mucuna pruriens]
LSRDEVVPDNLTPSRPSQASRSSSRIRSAQRCIHLSSSSTATSLLEKLAAQSETELVRLGSVRLLLAETVSDKALPSPYQTITIFIDTLPSPYYDKVVGNVTSNFVDLVLVGERIKLGIRHGKFAQASNNVGFANKPASKKKKGEANTVVVEPIFPQGKGNAFCHNMICDEARDGSEWAEMVPAIGWQKLTWPLGVSTGVFPRNAGKPRG